MLRDLNHLHGRTAVARDGDIGSVQDIYFDDEAWGVRYLEIDTGNWTTEGRVLISPYSVDHAGLCAADIVRVDLTRQQVRDSPSIDTHKPVSRQHEAEYLRYYGYPLYWGGPNLRGMGEYPVPGFIGAAPIPADVRQQFSLYGDKPPGDVHLRSASHVERCAIEAVDGSIGHIRGFIFDDEAWVIRYFVVDTRVWWPGGKEVLLATHWIDDIDWFASSVSTSLTRQAIKASPDYDESILIDRAYEARLHDFYRKSGYWSEEKGRGPARGSADM